MSNSSPNPEIAKHLVTPLAKNNYFKACEAAMLQTQEGLWLRVDYIDETNLEIHCHDEDSEEEYRLDILTEQDITFYRLQEIE